MKTNLYKNGVAKKLLPLCLSCLYLLVAHIAFAQSHPVTGRVTDAKNQPLAGATVVETGNEKNGTSSDERGNFQLTVKSNAVSLTISAVGFVDKQVTIGTGKTVNAQLSIDEKGLDEVVVVGYGRQKRITNTGAVSSVSGKEIRRVPTPGIENTLVGRLPGFFAQQRSGQPGGNLASGATGGTDFFIRGVNSLRGGTANNALILVDDIEYSYDQVQQLDANEIETVSILKDAATTAIYGIRGANGVLLITTRRGQLGRPQINVTGEVGIQKVIKMPTYLDAYSTALLRNEATVNDSYGLTTPLPLEFTQRDLELYKNGTDPYGHPNVNWVNTLLNTTASQSRQNIDISGGINMVKYFVSLGYFSQDGILKSFTPQDGNTDINPNYFYKRYNFRSNLDISPTKTLKLRFDINGRFATTNASSGIEPDAKGVMYDISRYSYMAPFAFPVENPNGTYGYSSYRSGSNRINPISRIANGGYKRNFNSDLNMLVSADQKLDFITKGLSARINLSYASSLQDFRNLTRNTDQLPAYNYNPLTNSYTTKNVSFTKFPVYTLSSGNNTYNNRVVLQAMVNYDRTFGNHHVYAISIINRNTIVDRAVLPRNYQGITGRAGYDFKRKYLIEFNLAYNGDDLFQEDRRYGLFPAVSAGWNVAEETFFKKALPFVDLFKIRGSFGLVGTDDGIGTPVLNQVYNSGQGNYNFGQTSTGATGVREGGLVNLGITWEKERKTDIGVDVNMFSGKLSFTGDYFYNYRYDQLISQNAVPLLIGQTVPARNNGISSNQGFDGSITWRNKIGKLDYSISANASYAKNKIIYISEAPDYPNLAQTGRQLGLVLGYINTGFYQVTDFDAAGKVKKGIPAPSWSVIQPGDLRYQDLNGDGSITTADRTFLAKPNLPTTTYGTQLSLGYKNFSLNALLQGAFNYSVYVVAEGTDAFNSNLRPWHLNRWTPATAATASYPRIGLNSNINNISWQTLSNFWYVDASYVRLKSLELGYQLPTAWARKALMRSARIYGTGYNLLSFYKMNTFQQDPEVVSGDGRAYPNTANFNVGVQLNF